MTLIQPSSELLISIRRQLNENVNTRENDLQHIKKWLMKQPHLPDTWDDECLMSFLRGCKFSLEKCKRKLDMYFTMRAAVPEFFSNRDISRPELQRIVQLVNIPPLPGLTPEGKRVIVLRGKDKNIETPNLADIAKIIFMISDVRLAMEKNGVAGDVYIFDASVATINHFSKVTPSLVKKLLVCVQEAYPVILKEVHVINISPIVDTIINWMKPFLPEEIIDCIHVHSDLDSLYKYIPKEMLPQEYGGTAGKLQDIHDQWIDKLKEYTSWFNEQENIKADESKRPVKPTNHEYLFGYDGSFRQLTID